MLQGISAQTRVVGLLGYPVHHSFSPAMHNAAFNHLNLDYCYLPFAVAPAELRDGVQGIRALGFRGVNVTIPHKEKVIPFLDELTDEARIMGAVNTIVNEGGRLIGYNTDGAGFVRSLQEGAGVGPEDKVFVIAGAGGAARGVAVALARRGAKAIYLAARNQEKARDLAQMVAGVGSCPAYGLALASKELEEALEGAQVFINASPVGMYPQHEAPPVIPTHKLRPSLLVCDLVYNPLQTRLLQEAAARGCTTLGGAGMLLHQGALAFELWTGRKAPVEVMGTALMEGLKGR